MPVSFDDLPDTGGKAAPAAKGPVSFDDLPEARPQSGGGGVGQALESGARALSMGVPFSDRMVAGAKSLPFVGTGKGYSQNLEEERAKRSQLRKEHPIATGLGEAAGGAVSSLALPAVGAGASLGSRVAGGVATGGMYGALQGASESPDLTKPKDVLSSASKGAAVGEAIGGAVPLATEAASRVISPFTIQPERQRHLDVLNREGIDVSAGQATGSKPLRYMESTLGDMPGAGGGVRKLEERQQRQLATAAGRRAGMTADEGLTDRAMADRYAQFNQEYDDLTAHNLMTVDPQLQTSLNDTLRTYHGSVNPNQERPIVADTVNDLLSRGALFGENYKNTRSFLGKRIESLSQADPPAAQALRDIRDAMHDAMGRGLPPDDRAKWSQIDRQYANYKVLETASTRAGEASAFGRLTPGALRSALAATKSGKARYARGAQDLSELARAAEAVLRTSESGLAPRWESLRAIELLGAGIAGHATLGAPGAALGVMAPGIASRAMMSPPAQAYLKNQAGAGLRSPNVTEYNKAGIGALGGALIQPDENSGQ